MNQAKIIWKVLIVASIGISLWAKDGTSETDAMMQQYGLEAVDFEYVLTKVGDGTPQADKVPILDARPVLKYNQGHIPTALPMPHATYQEYLHHLEGRSKETEIIAYCTSLACHKSLVLAGALKNLGYRHVKVYRGGIKEWQEREYVDISSEAAHSLYEQKRALFVDARPEKKYNQSTIIGALNLYEFWGRLPEDLQMPIIAFCGGPTCLKPYAIAHRLTLMGYSHAMTMSDGFLEWRKVGYATTSSPGSTAVVKKESVSSGPVKIGLDPGTVDIGWFQKMLTDKPSDIMVIDLRAEKSYAKGHFAGAVNVPQKEETPLVLTEFMTKIPQSGYVIFVCATGTTAAEAYEKVKNSDYPIRESVYYLDAAIKCQGMECQIEG